MDSYSKYEDSKNLLNKINKDENGNEDFTLITGDKSRAEQILFLFDCVKHISIDHKCKENAILLFDSVPNILQSNISFQRVFLISLIQLSLKVRACPVNIMEILDTLLTHLNTRINFRISKKEINMAEIFLLNSIDWNFNPTLVSDYINYFMLRFYPKIIKNVSLNHFFVFFTECSLTIFQTNLVSLHSLALCVILCSLDQYLMLPSYDGDPNTDSIIYFLEKCKFEMEIDLLRVENYKKFIYEFTDELNCVVERGYPDKHIRALLGKNSSNEKKNFKEKEKFLKKKAKTTRNKDLGGMKFDYVKNSQRCSLKYVSRKEFKEDNKFNFDMNYIKLPLKKFKSLSLNKFTKEENESD